MKKTINLIVAALLFTALAAAGATKFHINGTWEGGDGQTVYLKKDLGAKKFEDLDSVVVKNGKWALKGDYVADKRVIMISGSTIKRNFILEDKPIWMRVLEKTTTNKDGSMRKGYEIEVEPTPEQATLKAGSDVRLSSDMMELGMMMAMSKVRDDEYKLDSLQKMMVLIREQIAKRLTGLLDTTTNVNASAFVIIQNMMTSKPVADIEPFYERLSPAVKASFAGKELAQQIADKKQVSIGGTAPDIELPGPDGKTVKLSSLRGHYVLLDFWASWCRPCLAEVPNVKAIYDDYHAKGFEVFGVSLDETKDEKAWKSAIERFGMAWPQGCSGEGWNCPVARRYGVTGIPKMYLIDPQGVIIGMDLRGEKLREKVAELYK